MTIAFNTSVYTDPNMRPHLEKYYDQQYAPFYERIAQMQSTNNTPKTVTVAGTDNIATELSAEQYKAMIPSFDKWLEMQETLSKHHENFNLSDIIKTSERMLESLKARTPDSSSEVRAAFSHQGQILGYINQDGSVVTHRGGEGLQNLAEEADKLGLQGDAKIDFIIQRATHVLSQHNGQVDTTLYPEHNIPSMKDFAAQWYPHHNTEESYYTAIESAESNLKTLRAMQENQQNAHDKMMSFLMQSLQEAKEA